MTHWFLIICLVSYNGSTSCSVTGPLRSQKECQFLSEEFIGKANSISDSYTNAFGRINKSSLKCVGWKE